MTFPCLNESIFITCRNHVIQDKYRITNILGKGGIAVTYGAVNLPTKSNVAIKVIFLKQLNDWKQIELFKRKAEVLTKLKHTAIPKYIDYFALETNRIKIFSDRRDLIFFQFLAYLATIA